MDRFQINQTRTDLLLRPRKMRVTVHGPWLRRSCERLCNSPFPAVSRLTDGQVYVYRSTDGLNAEPGARLPGFESQLRDLGQITYPISLCLNPRICKTGIIIKPTSLDGCEDYGIKAVPVRCLESMQHTSGAHKRSLRSVRACSVVTSCFVTPRASSSTLLTSDPRPALLTQTG